MTEETPRTFDGFILPDGEMVSIEDVDRMVSFLCGRMEDRDRIVETLWGLAQECTDHGQFGAACAYAEKILSMSDSAADKAFCLLRMGQAREQAGDYSAAWETYSRAFELPQEENDVWYFLNNNLAYCENLAGRHKAALKHCQTAISIDPARHNAYKNLGVAMQGLNRFADAAMNYVVAADNCPSDPRALRLLEDLLMTHPEVFEEVPDLLDALDRGQPEVEAMMRRLRPQ